MTLLEKLEKALEAKGLNKELAKFIKIENESEIEGIVSGIESTQKQEVDFSEILKSEDFEKYVDEHGFDKVLELSKKLQSGNDKKVTQALQTRLKKMLEGKTGGPEEDDEEEDKMPAWAKTLVEKVDRFEKSQTTKSKREKALEALTKSKVPKRLHKKWIDRFDLEDEDIEKQVKGLEQEYEEIQKEFIGETVGRGLPAGGKVDGKVSDEEVESVLDQMN